MNTDFSESIVYDIGGELGLGIEPSYYEGKELVFWAVRKSDGHVVSWFNRLDGEVEWLLPAAEPHRQKNDKFTIEIINGGKATIGLAGRTFPLDYRTKWDNKKYDAPVYVNGYNAWKVYRQWGEAVPVPIIQKVIGNAVRFVKSFFNEVGLSIAQVRWIY